MGRSAQLFLNFIWRAVENKTMKDAIRILTTEINCSESCIVTWKEWGLKEGDLWEGRDAIKDKRTYIRGLRQALKILKQNIK